MKRLREQSMASSVIRLERRIFHTWRRNHKQFRATRHMARIHRRIFMRHAFADFRVKAEIHRRKIFMHIRAQQRVHEIELRWKSMSWIRRVNANRFKKVRVKSLHHSNILFTHRCIKQHRYISRQHVSFNEHGPDIGNVDVYLSSSRCVKS